MLLLVVVSVFCFLWYLNFKEIKEIWTFDEFYTQEGHEYLERMNLPYYYFKTPYDFIIWRKTIAKNY